MYVHASILATDLFEKLVADLGSKKQVYIFVHQLGNWKPKQV